jgi:hypothetical protein
VREGLFIQESHPRRVRRGGEERVKPGERRQ